MCLVPMTGRCHYMEALLGVYIDSAKPSVVAFVCPDIGGFWSKLQSEGLGPFPCWRVRCPTLVFELK